jgi:NAD(P)-dependent dehydrogenase (short-subunit alcohol dehydrogenase family)
MQRLRDRVALVTGSSRSAGRSIALVLGGEGAIVYVTGRSVRGEPTTLGRAGTIETTPTTPRWNRSSTASEPTTAGSTCS